MNNISSCVFYHLYDVIQSDVHHPKHSDYKFPIPQRWLKHNLPFLLRLFQCLPRHRRVHSVMSWARHRFMLHGRRQTLMARMAKLKAIKYSTYHLKTCMVSNILSPPKIIKQQQNFATCATSIHYIYNVTLPNSILGALWAGNVHTYIYMFITKKFNILPKTYWVA